MSIQRDLQKPKNPRRRILSEAAFMREFLLEMSKKGVRLWRNQVGTYKLIDGRVITTGFGRGSSDLIGYTPVVITQDMVGQKIAVFTAYELKSETGKATPNQLWFIDHIKKAGGIAALVKPLQQESNAK